MSARLIAALTLGLALYLAPSSAAAHAVGLSRGEYRAVDAGLLVELTLAREEALAAVPELDADGDGKIDERELERARAAPWVEKIRVTREGAPCAGELTSIALTDRDGLSVRATYRCPDTRGPFAVKLDLLADLSFGHRHAAHLVAGTLDRDELCTRAHDTFDVPVRQPTEGETGEASSSAGAFLRMGFEHILTGVDHVVFLFGLVIVTRRLRPVLLVVTAFTVGHSVTLALSVLGVVHLSPRLVEPAIAVSIAYVGIENLFLHNADARWRITFPFGLVHGFGFAGALAEVAIPPAKVAVSLFLFNLGVELGQLAILAVLLPVIWHLRKHGGFERRLVPALSVVVVLAGLAFLVDRVAGSIQPASSVAVVAGD